MFKGWRGVDMEALGSHVTVPSSSARWSSHRRDLGRFKAASLLLGAGERSKYEKDARRTNSRRLANEFDSPANHSQPLHLIQALVR